MGVIRKDVARGLETKKRKTQKLQERRKLGLRVIPILPPLS